MDALGAPDWIAQRLWSGLLLVLAYEGCRQLAKAMGLTGSAAIVAGLAYSLSPRMVGSAGVLTGEVGPVAMLPWAVLPLVLVNSGRWSPRTGALLSGVAVLCMGGINAVGTLAVLPAGLVVVLAQWHRPHGRRLLGWWLVAMLLACTWWMLPLLLLGRYSPPFLDYIETASATTATTGWSNAVRGTDHWVAWSTAGDRAWWPGPHEIATTPALVVLGDLSPRSAWSSSPIPGCPGVVRSSSPP
nr:alpha-(1->3)-arabinofuranosyltransferase family protein [Nocardioides alcanivorans]